MPDPESEVWNCRGQAHAVNEARYPLAHGYHRHNGDSCKLTDASDEPCILRTATLTTKLQASAEKIVLFHYATKSMEDFLAKRARGSGNKALGRPTSFFERWRKCDSPQPRSQSCIACPASALAEHSSNAHC